MKKVLALGLSLALTLSLGVTALAEEGVMPIADDAVATLPDAIPVEDADGVAESGTEPVVFPGPSETPETVDVPLSSHYSATISWTASRWTPPRSPTPPTAICPCACSLN